MININRVVLVGRLTRDVEVRKTGSGLSVATFTVAVSRRYSRQDSQNNQPNADFISCVAWRQSADFLGNYGKKGTLIGVEGRIQTRNYDAADGHKVYVTEVVCDSVELESRRDSNNGGSYSQNQNSYNNNGYNNNSYNSGSSYNGGGYTSYNNNNSYSSNNSNNNNNDNGGQDAGNPGDALGITGNDLPF